MLFFKLKKNPTPQTKHWKSALFNPLMTIYSSSVYIYSMWNPSLFECIQIQYPEFRIVGSHCFQNSCCKTLQYSYTQVRLTFRALVLVPPSRCAPRKPWLRSYSDICATTLTPAATLGSIMALSLTWAAHWVKTTSWMRMSSFSSFDSILISSLLQSCCISTMTSQKANITSCDLWPVTKKRKEC